MFPPLRTLFPRLAPVLPPSGPRFVPAGVPFRRFFSCSGRIRGFFCVQGAFSGGGAAFRLFLRPRQAFQPRQAPPPAGIPTSAPLPQAFRAVFPGPRTHRALRFPASPRFPGRFSGVLPLSSPLRRVFPVVRLLPPLPPRFRAVFFSWQRSVQGQRSSLQVDLKPAVFYAEARICPSPGLVSCPEGASGIAREAGKAFPLCGAQVSGIFRSGVFPPLPEGREPANQGVFP